MKITIDKVANAAYLYFISDSEHKKSKLRTVPVDENIVIDYTEEGKLFGIEILSLEILNLENLQHIEFQRISSTGEDDN